MAVTAEAAPTHLKGLQGEVVSQVGSQVQILIFADGKAAMKVVAASDLEVLPDLPHPPAPKSKNLNWLDGQLGKLICALLPMDKDFLAPSLNTMLTNNQVEAGLVELLWRLLPGKVVVLSSHWLSFAVMEHTLTSKALRKPEMEIAIQEQVELAKKGELLICPLLVQEPCKHWSLSCFCSDSQEAAAAAAAAI